MPRNKLDIILEDAAAVIKAVDFSWLRNKTVILTGATGLLGTHFLACLALLNAQGAKNLVFAFYHSEPAEYTREIVSSWSGLYLLDADVPTALDADVTIHLSGYAQPSKFTHNPAETIRINTELTRRLLSALRPDGKFLFASSSEVYSGLISCSVNESWIGTTTPSHPRSGYIEGKRCGEAIVNAYRQAGVDAKSVRLGLTYGPGYRKNDQRAMSNFIEQALTYQWIKMKYSGMEKRSFCYVRDAVEMMWNVLLHGKEPVYNVGNRSIHTIGQVVSTIAAMTQADVTFPSDITELPGANGSVTMDVSLVENEFDKKWFYIPLVEGLRRTIEWHRGLNDSI